MSVCCTGALHSGFMFGPSLLLSYGVAVEVLTKNPWIAWILCHAWVYENKDLMQALRAVSMHAGLVPKRQGCIQPACRAACLCSVLLSAA